MFFVCFFGWWFCWESARKEGVVNAACLRPFFPQEQIYVNQRWCRIVRALGTKVIFAKGRIRHTAWQVLGVFGEGEWKMWDQPSATCHVGVPPGPFHHQQHDLILSLSVCFWLSCVKNFFLRQTVFQLQPSCRNAWSDTSEKSIWDHYLFSEFLHNDRAGWNNRAGYSDIVGSELDSSEVRARVPTRNMESGQLRENSTDIQFCSLAH